jgi:hypothetical protein
MQMGLGLIHDKKLYHNSASYGLGCGILTLTYPGLTIICGRFNNPDS